MRGKLSSNVCTTEKMVHYLCVCPVTVSKSLLGWQESPDQYCFFSYSMFLISNRYYIFLINIVQNAAYLRAFLDAYAFVVKEGVSGQTQR